MQCKMRYVVNGGVVCKANKRAESREWWALLASGVG